MSRLRREIAALDRAQANLSWEEARAMAEPLASGRFDAGVRLTEDEHDVLRHTSMWGLNAPVHKIGKHWSWDWKSVKAPQLYATKHEAVAAWHRYHDMLVVQSGLEARERALRERAGGR